MKAQRQHKSISDACRAFYCGLLVQTSWRARANAAQANSYEVLPFFIGAVIIAHQLGAAQTPLDMLCLAFVLLRVLYIAMYVGDLPTARSLIWSAGFAANLGIFFLGYR